MARVNYRAALVRRAKVDGKWVRGVPARDKRGAIKPDYMLVNGVEHHAPDGQYQVRYYEGSKTLYDNVGNDLDKAQDSLERILHAREEERLNQKHGVKKNIVQEVKTLAALVAVYIQAKKSPSLELSHTSIRHYEDTLPAFLAIAKGELLADITEAHIIAYMDSLKKQGYSQKTRVMRYVCLRGFLRNSGVLVDKIIDSATHKRYSAKLEGKTDPYTQGEIDKLFAVCDDHHRTVFHFLLATGLRYREASHLTWANVDFQNNVINVPGEQKINRKYQSRKTGKLEVSPVEFKTKSRKGRKVPLFASLKPVMLKWREQNPSTVFVFGTRRSDLPDGHWLERGKQFWSKAGLDCGVCDSCVADKTRWTGGCEKFYLHKFRHTFAHRCLDGGNGVHRVSKWLGHHSIEVTAIYLSGSTQGVDKDPFASAA